MNEQEYASRPPTREPKTKAPTLSKIPPSQEPESNDSGGGVVADRAVAGGLVRLG